MMLTSHPDAFVSEAARQRVQNETKTKATALLNAFKASAGPLPRPTGAASIDFGGDEALRTLGDALFQ